MADPVSIAAIVGMTASAGAGITGAFGSLFSGEASSNMYSYQAGVARMNQQIAKQNADYTRAAGEVMTQRAGMEGSQRMGTITAAQSASGVDINSESSVDVRNSQLTQTQMNEATIRSNTARRAYGYELEGFEKGTEAELADISSKNAKTAGKINAVSSLLGGASSVASKWSTYKTDFGSKDNSMGQGGMGLYSGEQTGSLY